MTAQVGHELLEIAAALAGRHGALWRSGMAGRERLPGHVAEPERQAETDLANRLTRMNTDNAENKTGACRLACGGV